MHAHDPIQAMGKRWAATLLKRPVVKATVMPQHPQPPIAIANCKPFVDDLLLDKIRLAAVKPCVDDLLLDKARLAASKPKAKPPVYDVLQSLTSRNRVPLGFVEVVAIRPGRCG